MDQLQEAIVGSQMNLLTHELLLNFSFRQNEDKGVLTHCRERRIKSIAYQPLHKAKTETNDYELLVDFSDKYNVSQAQIILNWLVYKGTMPLIRSDDTEHIDEDLESLSFTLEEHDYKAIEQHRIPEIVNTDIDWSDSGVGTHIYQIANKF